MAKKEKKQKKQHVSALEMYSNIIYDMVTKGARHNNQELGVDHIHIGYDRIYTGSCMKAYYYVKAFPSEIPMSLMDDIRNYCYHDNVRINFNINMAHHVINWQSVEMKDNRRIWNKKLEESASEDKEFLGSKQDEIKNERELWLIKSWKEIQQADMDKKALCFSDLLIEVTTINNSLDSFEEFNKTCYKLEQYCAMYDIDIKRVRNMLLDFLQYTSPVMDKTGSYSSQTIPSRVLYDEVVSNMTPFTPGKLSGKDLVMGIDVRTNQFVYLDIGNIMKNSLNILLAAATSGGKSVMAKCMIREFLAHQVNAVVLDRDGEYKPLTRQCQGAIIDLDRATGRYFDSMQIGDLTGYAEIDASLYTDAIVATTSTFNVLISIDNGMNTSERKIYNDAYNILLNRAGVFKDKPETWKNSEKLRYHDLYGCIVDLSKNSAYQERYGKTISDMVDKLSVYFEPNGLRSHLFREKVGINDVLNTVYKDRAAMVDICLYLDKDTDQTTEGRVEQTIKHITASYLTILLTNYFHSKGQKSATFIEEYQRYDECGNIQSLVLNMVTGNRKRNAATVLITNSPQEIVRGSRATTLALVDNIKNLVLGKITSKDTIESICRAWSIPFCVDTLTEIATKPQYDKCFMFRPESGEIAVVKQYMPAELMKSPMFSTS